MASTSSGAAAAAAPAPNVGATATAAITVERKPPAARLSELGVSSWPKWGGPPGRYALSYGARQTCYIVRGKASATVEVEGSPEGSCTTAQFGAGDVVVFARGTRCVWHIVAAVDMHYAFDPS